MTYDEQALIEMTLLEEQNNAPELLRRLRKALSKNRLWNDVEASIGSVLTNYITEEDAIKHIDDLFKKGYKLKDVCRYLSRVKTHLGIYKLDKDGKLIDGDPSELSLLRDRYVRALMMREKELEE